MNRITGQKSKYITYACAAVFMAVCLLCSVFSTVTASAEEDWAQEEVWQEETAWEDTGDEGWYDEGYQDEQQWYDEGAQEEVWYEEEQPAEDTWQEEDPDAAAQDWNQEEDWAQEETWQEDTEAARETQAAEDVTEDTSVEETTQEQTTAAPAASEQTPQKGTQTWPRTPELAGEAVVLMEANTQAVVFEKNADKKMYPASTTKILTALVVLENCSLNETVTFTQECCDLEDGAVTIDSVPGEQMSLKDVMYGLLLPSGNDCAMALALHTAGSVERFAEMMNEKAHEIGADSSNFVNPSGLFNMNHYTTASDLAQIARYAFQNSTFVDIISHPTYIIEPTNMTPESRVLVNTHEMITPGNPDYSSDVIGGKTGYLYEAGRCLVTYAQRDGVTLLAVILDGSYYGIFGETQELLNFGWDNFTIVNVSESERRFSYNDEDARVQLDPASEIVTLNNVPFNELSSRINYAYYLDEDEYARAKEEAGILPGDPRQLYAWIDYYYAGYFLGSCNVFINPDLKVSKASFIDMIYINIWLLLLVIAAVIAAVILIIRMAGRNTAGSANAKAHRRSGRARTRYYSRSDSVDLRNQYVRRGNRDRQSIHDLNEIGVPHGRRTNTGSMATLRREQENREVYRPPQRRRPENTAEVKTPQESFDIYDEDIYRLATGESNLRYRQNRDEKR